ncbi:3'-5' exonuclease, partial [Mycobacterium tuberculosis]
MTIPELFVSVDVEASGPIPGEFSLLSIGAVLVDRPETTFYIELKPEGTRHDPESLAVSGFNIDELTLSGIEPSAAMQDFGNWLSDSCTQGQKPVFVGL